MYRRYASLFVLAGVDGDENALVMLELVHAYVEALDRYFGAVCELDIMFHLDKVRVDVVLASLVPLAGLTPRALPVHVRRTSFWTK